MIYFAHSTTANARNAHKTHVFTGSKLGTRCAQVVNSIAVYTNRRGNVLWLLVYQVHYIHNIITAYYSFGPKYTDDVLVAAAAGVVIAKLLNTTFYNIRICFALSWGGRRCHDL